MARARNIKPGLFKNEDLAECSIWARFIFPGLWMLADREGRLEDRPKRIKGELLPYDSEDVEPLLDELSRFGFIVRYEIGGQRFIQICKFAQHQAPHIREQASSIPAPPDAEQGTTKAVPSTSQGSGEPSPGSPDSLNPSSLIPDPLILIPEGSGAEKSAPTQKQGTEKPETELQTACKEVWKSYCDAYFTRYGTDPVRNATVNAQVKAFVKRIGAQESAQVAAFFVQSNSAFYVQRLHSFGNLLADAEKVRTEWATGNSMTATRARQIDQTGANSTVAAEAMKLLEQQEVAA